jgi:sec-independent protein translocase protein TatB
MFDIAFSELVLIGIIALVVLGPKRLPEVARAAGRWTARIRRFVADVKQDFDRELQQADLAEFRKLKEELADTRRLMEETTGQLANSLAATANPESKSAAPPAIAPPAPEAAAVAVRGKKPRPKKKHVSTRKARRSARG